MVVGKLTIDSFREHTGGAKDPIAGGVAVAAVSAGLGMGLLAMTLEVALRRKGLSGNRTRLKMLLKAANKESEKLIRYADEDIAAYHMYRESLRRKRGVERAQRRIIQTPWKAACAAARGLDWCAEAMTMAPRSVASDVGAAAALLAGCVRAMLLTVDVNLRELPRTSELRRRVRKQRRELERRASKQLDRLLGR